ncbi:MAG: hypothetical protein GYB31_01345 [Bacteroidetes bacterium]|nr:hypothetical protein [Bacteroidota bacterium]
MMDVFRKSPEQLHWRQSFEEELLFENLRKSRFLSWLGVLFFFLLMTLDATRYFHQEFTTKAKIIQSLSHFWFLFYIIPAVVIQRNWLKILRNNYSKGRQIIGLNIGLLTVSLLTLSVTGLIDRDSLVTFPIYILIINLVYLLPTRERLLLNILSLIVVGGAVLIIQWDDISMLIVNMIELLAFTIPVFLAADYQYSQRGRQFINERRLEKQNEIIERSLKREYETKIAELELMALRAQMNPHFLFNVLNSIRLYVLNNKSDQAANYLNKFSRLIRLILNNSKSGLVSLSEELKALTLYVELEQFRFDDSFDFDLEVSTELDIDFVKIPPTILQPYVENAIWHGLMHKEKGRGHLSVRIFPKGENLWLQVEDNGIGREMAQQVRPEKTTKHKSMGMKITSDRIALSNRIFKTNARVEIEDLRNPDTQKPTGTRVSIFLPVPGDQVNFSSNLPFTH